jgi:hypothetical protein
MRRFGDQALTQAPRMAMPLRTHYSHACNEGSYGAISMRAFRGSPMAPRWIKTKDYKPSNFLPISEDDDWLLLSGEFVVGRVLPPGANRVGRLFNWSMTGPHGPKVCPARTVDPRMTSRAPRPRYSRASAVGRNGPSCRTAARSLCGARELPQATRGIGNLRCLARDSGAQVVAGSGRRAALLHTMFGHGAAIDRHLRPLLATYSKIKSPMPRKKPASIAAGRAPWISFRS